MDGQDSLGDFLDEETMTWIPLHMLESICELTKPVLPASKGPVPTDDDDDEAEADHLRRKNAIADARGGTVLYANALDKLYEAGVLKLSKGQVFLCHQLLSQRAVRFKEVYLLPFEGYKDMSACIAYYPHDMDMYWYRGHLHQRYHNYDAAIDDLTSVCEYIWIGGGVDGGMS
ncbi:hypothetical protein DYB28_004452 [Aphanomyces astaci]|uniref:Uncharacterized protein n=1 Tax=Aphanomyces astaci TaxID=112090 RepID=A0A9X8E3N0_APHAT|nr:hypothetical protein DYB28_004452 [Aphanomyces astaci]